MRALYTAATGMAAQQLKVDTIANNLANVNTDGFKAGRAEFEELYYEKVRMGGGKTEAGTGRSDGVEVGHGTRAASLRRDFSSGQAVETNRETDLAIDGAGFFAVQTPDGDTLYTRDGRFDIDSEGNFVTRDGFTVGDGITIPDGATALNVSGDGVLSAKVDGQDEVLGHLQLQRFRSPGGLDALGGGYYRATEQSGEATAGTAGTDGFGEIRQNAIEGSNVDVAQELIGMILAQRSYELTGKAITASDEMLQTTNNLVR